MERSQSAGDSPAGTSAERTATGGDAAAEESLALRRALLYVVLPFWFVPGIADWYWHRKTGIERTSGTHESLTHVLMMSAVGVPVTAALLLDINALVLAMMIGGCVVHEGISLWDVSYANARRPVPPLEQHTHSFLEVLPFAATAFTICLSPKQFAAMIGRGDETPRWRFEPKRPSLTARYVASILGSVAAFVALPYAEEFVRCYRADHTLLPHPAPDKEPEKRA